MHQTSKESHRDRQCPGSCATSSTASTSTPPTVARPTSYDPSTGAGGRHGAGVLGRGRRPGLRGRRGRVRDVARHHPQRAAEGAAEVRRRGRGPRRRARQARGREHRQADRAHRQRRDSADGRPDPLLRRRRPGPGGPVGRGVPGRPHLVDPPRADRRHRPGHALELPDDDGGLEVRPGRSPPATPWCSSRATPRRSPRCCWPRSPPSSCRPGVLNVVTGDRDTGRALVEHPTPQMVSITGSVRAGMEVAGSAARDLKRVHLELGGKAPVVVFDDADIEAAAEAIAVAGYFNAGQDCTAATRVLAAPGIHDDFVAALAEQAKGRQDRSAARRRGRPARPGQQRQPARPGRGLRRPAARPRRRRRPAGAGRRSATATSTSRPWSPACGRTTR